MSTLNMETAPTNISNTTTVQIDRLERAYTQGKFYKAIIIFLLIIVISVSFFIYSLLTKSSLIPSDISELLLDTLVCKSCEKEGDECESIQSNQKYSSWSVYQYPKYGFSIELPNNSGFLSQYESEAYRYVWSVSNFSAQEQPEFAVFPNFTERVSISYFPIRLPDVATELNYFQASQIYVDFYKNIEKLTIEETEELLSNFMQNKFKNDPELANTFTSEFTTYLSKDAFTFEQPTLFEPYQGVVLLTDEYIVYIDKSFIFSKGEELKIVNNVIGTIRIK